jgi:hypothetical protein
LWPGPRRGKQLRLLPQKASLEGLQVDAGSILNITGATTQELSASLNNAGTINIDSGGLHLNDNVSIYNNGSGTFNDAMTGADSISAVGSTADQDFWNSGTFKKTGGFIAVLEIPFINYKDASGSVGTADIQGGTLQITAKNASSNNYSYDQNLGTSNTGTPITMIDSSNAFGMVLSYGYHQSAGLLSVYGTGSATIKDSDVKIDGGTVFIGDGGTVCLFGVQNGAFRLNGSSTLKVTVDGTKPQGSRCSGLTAIDVVIANTTSLYVNEVNPFPPNYSETVILSINDIQGSFGSVTGTQGFKETLTVATTKKWKLSRGAT